MNCRNCGGPINENEKFCKHCGSKNEQNYQSNSYYTNNITFDQIAGHNNSYSTVIPGAKSRILAGVLALLTSFGIYNFYLGYKKKAIIQLVISIIGFVFSIALRFVYASYGEVLLCYILALGYVATALAVGIWSLVDAIRLFTRKLNVDGKGNPLF